MPDPLTTDADGAADTLSGSARAARVEQLLLTGLDHYFGGQYDQAIHVWTRVLFLDRGHARARAYIDRARSAQAERQRESDELLHHGTRAFEDGEADAARRLLTAAVDGGAAPEVALGYLGRLDRLASVARGSDPAPRSETAILDHPLAVIHARPRKDHRRLVLAMALSAAALTAVWWFAGSIADFAGVGAVTGRASLIPGTEVEPLPVPLSSDLDLARARALYNAGHAREALHLLSGISVADGNRPDADRLQADIQRMLLSVSDPAADQAATSTER